MSLVSRYRLNTISIPIITFVAAFCSIVYELLLSQALTIVFGGTVLRYSITIGLFLFSLGIGALLYKHIKDIMRPWKLFFLVELILSCIGFFGIFFIFVGSVFLQNYLPSIVIVFLSHLPIIVIGVLSGLEIPILADCDDSRGFTSILGIDYFGSLAGTVVYALFLFPVFGLIVTTVCIVSLNLVLAIAALFLYNTLVFKKRIVLGVLLLSISAFTWWHIQPLETWIERIYLSDVIMREYKLHNVELARVDLKEHFNTMYQEVTLYDIHFQNTDLNPTDSCLSLDEHIQMCDRWVDAYHKGLVHVPLSLFPEGKKLSVLVLGGGDFLPAKYLRAFDERIDSITVVDLDREFQDFAKTHPYLVSKNEHSFEYEKVTVVVEDALQFLKNSDKTYDLILSDLPGLRHDKMLPLYSREFYARARNALSQNGLFVSWRYPNEIYPEHGRILENTLREVGFSRVLEYVAWNTLPSGEEYATETFFVVGKNSESLPTARDDVYLNTFEEKYEGIAWRALHASEDEGINSVFKPNYAMLITAQEK